MAAKDIDPLNDGVDLQSIETGAQDWAVACGVCHIGGGQLEYDRNLQDYSAASPSGDRYYFEMPSLAHPAGRLTSVDAEPDGLSGTNKAELDCLLCHLKSTDPAGSGNGRAWLQSMGCNNTDNQMGPSNDPTCSGTSSVPGVPAAGPFTPGTAYDMYNRNLALKTKSFGVAASLGLGAVVTAWTPNGNVASIGGVPQTVAGENIATTPESSNCSVCHARDDSTPGLPGMMAMKYGYGNFALISPPGTAQDTDKSVTVAASNDLLWFELGCKTGMGKRTHKIGQGPNADWGMSMFNIMFGLGKNPGDPVLSETIAATNPMFSGWSVTTAERMPDADVHDIDAVTGAPTGMACGSCHFALGSENKYIGGLRNPSYVATNDQTAENSRFFEATTRHGVPYPEETVWAVDHQFAQADSYPDTKSKNNLDGTVSCESCHTTRDHPRLTDNGGTLSSPTPIHAGFPAVHIQKIACATCHIPEVYGAPGRLKYRDWTVGQTKGGFRNMLDWNYDLITGSHKTMPVLRAWLTKNEEQKIYPFLPSVMPIWLKSSVNSGSDQGSELLGGTYPTASPMTYPVKARNNVYAAKAVKDANPAFDIRLNGGNMVPLFDGFSLPDSWEIDTKAEIDAMTDPTLLVDGTQFASKLKLFNTMFDVTHGVAPKDWALGGSKRGGCVNCHSSANPQDPRYSPKSAAFFEGYQQPLNNAGMGIGQYDLLKNWFALFADYDCTAYCGLGLQPDSHYFDPAGNPIAGTACETGSPMPTIDACVDFMTSTFDAAMGFPPGTAKMMGMNDGIAGLQGFTVRETVSGATLGCNPFAGAASMSPVAGYSVNNCMPSNNPAFTQGTCLGADPPSGIPGACDNLSFRYNGMCMDNADCNGVLFSAEEYAANPNGLLYQRDEVRSHFKIALQQSGTGAASKVTWPIKVEKNPNNSAHVYSWDQAQQCVNPMTGAEEPCADGSFIKTTIHANQLLGYDAATLAKLTNPATAGVPVPQADFSYAKAGLTVNVDAAPSLCPSGNCTYTWDFGDTGTGTGVTAAHDYAAAGTYNVNLTVVDNVNTTRDSRTIPIDFAGANAAPVAAFTSNLVDYGSPPYKTSHDWTVNLTDTSTDEVPATLTINVDWGDGSPMETIVGAGSTFSHAYLNPSSYTIRYTVVDEGGRDNAVTQAIKITRYGITGTVTRSDGTTPLAWSRVELRQAATLIQRTYTDGTGNYALRNLKPGTYTLTVIRSGYTFAPVDVTVGPDGVVNVSANP